MSLYYNQEKRIEDVLRDGSRIQYGITFLHPILSL
jgi:hypothetical protein